MSGPKPIARWLNLFLLAVAATLLLTVAPEALAQAGGEAAPATTSAAEAPDPEQAAADGADWIGFLGRLHLVVLHLPIGLLLGAFVLEVFGLFRRSRGYDYATAWVLVLGTLGAVVAVVFGLFYEQEKGSSLTMEWHKWLGIAVAALAFIAMFMKINANRRQWQGDDKMPGGFGLVAARLSLIGAVVLLPVVGHLGGNMVHGKEHLFEKSPVAVPDVVVHFPNKPPEEVVAATGGLEARWIEEVQPILDLHCTKCHGDAKQNADIRLDTLPYALEGRDLNGTPIIQLGQPEHSRLYQVMVLPPDAEMFMPPGKDDALTLADLRVVADWLLDAADLGNEPTTEGGTEAGGGGESDMPPGPAYDVAAVQRAAGLGVGVAPEAQGGDKLFVSFANQRDPVTDEQLAALEPIADSIKRLDFSNASVTDAELSNLPELPELRRLYLKDTAITDTGLANLPEMFSLTFLNLFGTQVTDASIDLLADLVLPGINEDGEMVPGKIYLSETGVTLEGVQRLREALGDDVEVIYDDTVGILPSEDAASDAGDGSDAGANSGGELVMVNTVCPVSGEAQASAEHTLEHDGRLIGFCCANCKGRFAEDPTPYLANLP